MNYQKLLKETVMPVAIALAAFSLNPFAGVEASAAARTANMCSWPKPAT